MAETRRRTTHEAISKITIWVLSGSSFAINPEQTWTKLRARMELTGKGQPSVSASPELVAGGGRKDPLWGTMPFTQSEIFKLPSSLFFFFGQKGAKLCSNHPLAAWQADHSAKIFARTRPGNFLASFINYLYWAKTINLLCSLFRKDT